MTAMTPLESIHKKGIFGNHHKKNKSDLLKISEVKALTIFQVFQYKRSKVNFENINIDGIKPSKQSLAVSSNEKTRILWNAPRTWLVVSQNENIFKTIKENCNEENFAITDISHSRAVIQIEGNGATEILKKGCPINFNEFKENNCAGTVFQGINILVEKLSDKPEKFNIFTLRSFAESLYFHITDASLEDGYLGV